MCVVSMVYDHYYEKWKNTPPPPNPYIYPPPPYPIMPWVAPPSGLPTQQELEEFRRLLERARKYDIETGQKDCELEEKKRKVKELAESFGLDIEFVLKD